MVSMFDHRAASIEFRPRNELRHQQPVLHTDQERADPCFGNEAFLGARWAFVRERLSRYWTRRWLAVFKRVTSATNERTLVGCFLPWSAVSYTLYIVLCPDRNLDVLPGLMASMFSFAGDYLVRQKTTQPSLPMGAVYETAFPGPETYRAQAPWDQERTTLAWMIPRIMELSYTAWDLEHFAKDFGYDCPPFRWDADRRFLLRCELDAAFFHLYGIERHDVGYLMETFPSVERKDIRKHGERSTRLRILAIYDRMQRAMDTGEPCQTLLDPPPADLRVAHPNQPPVRRPLRVVRQVPVVGFEEEEKR